MHRRSVRTVISQINQTAACWTWPGRWSIKGYPAVEFDGKPVLVHRLAYQALIAPLGPSQRLRQACDTPGCVRPGPGHWAPATPPQTPPSRQQPPRGITFEGVDRHGQEVWRLSVYLGRDAHGGQRRVEQRERVHGPLEAAVKRRTELLERVNQERRKLAAGVRGKPLRDLLDAYLTVWQRTPRKGHLPAPKTVYQRTLLVANLITPALGHRIPADITPGEIAEWYDRLMATGYTTTRTVTEFPAAGTCRRCGHQAQTVITGRRLTTQVACPACPAVRITCRRTGTRRTRQAVLRRRPVSGSTMGDVHSILTGAFRFGVQRGWLPLVDNPMLLVQRPSRLLHRQPPPTSAQVRRLLAAAAEHADPNLYPMLALLADTGARLGEVCSLRWSEVHPDSSVTLATSLSEVPARFGGRQVKDTKTHNQRTIAIHPTTLGILHAHQVRCRHLAALAGADWPEDPYVFPTLQGRQRRLAPAEPCSTDRMSKQISDLFDSLGIDATAKGLRSFVVTTWRTARVPDDVLRGRLGHEEGTPITDRHYHFRQAAADRQETDALVGQLLYPATTGPDAAAQFPAGPGGNVIPLAARRAQRQARREGSRG